MASQRHYSVIPNHTSTAKLNRPPRVMVVEDDLTSREFLRRALEKNGCQVATADCVDAAQKIFAEHEADWFDTVVTDYRMPGRNGLELLDWINTKDSCLKGIILTSEAEKNLVADSLRAGASDFLEKPVNLQKLIPALNKAVNATHHLRHLAETESAVQNLGRAQKDMVHDRTIPVPGFGVATLDVCFHPKLEAGGDFFSHFMPAPGKISCLLTDVSGHDLQAAYISAYFQGIVRGMLQLAAPVSEIFHFFNCFLVEEWGRDGLTGQDRNRIETSIAASSVLIDFKESTAGVLTCGTPAPVNVSADGRAWQMGKTGGAPLGWFIDQPIQYSTHSIENSNCICMWTDGLEELADRMEVHPLCVAMVLENARRQHEKPPLLDDAKDDILFASIRLPNNPAAAGHFVPLLIDTYRGDQQADIDQFMGRWRRHLQYAVPGLSKQSEHDILLATREAVLNAMKHGCESAPNRAVRVQFSCHPVRKALKIWVEDPGPGHGFDFAGHEQVAADEILGEHRGLIFMINLAHSVNFERNGATVIMEFKL